MSTEYVFRHHLAPDALSSNIPYLQSHMDITFSSAWWGNWRLEVIVIPRTRGCSIFWVLTWSPISQSSGVGGKPATTTYGVYRQSISPVNLKRPHLSPVNSLQCTIWFLSKKVAGALDKHRTWTWPALPGKTMRLTKKSSPIVCLYDCEKSSWANLVAIEVFPTVPSPNRITC